MLTDSLILVKSIVSAVGALSLRRGRYGGPTAFPPPIHTYQGTSKGPWDRRQLLHVQHEEVRLPDDRLLQEQMLRIYIHLGMLSTIKCVMRGLDPRICRWPEMAGSSPAMTYLVKVKLDSGIRRNDNGV